MYQQAVFWSQPRLHDASDRGHNAPPDYKFKIYTSKQKRRVTPKIKREMRRRSAIEPVIGHLKHEHRMDRNYLADRKGGANNAILCCRRVQLPLPDQVAQDSMAPHPDHALRQLKTDAGLKDDS